MKLKVEEQRLADSSIAERTCGNCEYRGDETSTSGVGWVSTALLDDLLTQADPALEFGSQRLVRKMRRPLRASADRVARACRDPRELSRVIQEERNRLQFGASPVIAAFESFANNVRDNLA
jgi:hypothetical protein